MNDRNRMRCSTALLFATLSLCVFLGMYPQAVYADPTPDDIANRIEYLTGLTAGEIDQVYAVEQAPDLVLISYDVLIPVVLEPKITYLLIRVAATGQWIRQPIQSEEWNEEFRPYFDSLGVTVHRQPNGTIDELTPAQEAAQLAAEATMPASDTALLIFYGQSVTTIHYNVHGNLISASQGGITEYRVYDAYQQLCKMVRPDVGNTAFSYNAVGALDWQASGGSVSGSTTACDRSVIASARIDYDYDNLGNVRTVTFGDSSPDKSYTYDKNSRLETLVAGPVTTTYDYNSKNLIELETLSIDGQTFSLDYAYDANGYLSSTIYPSGASIGYLPNALGQATKAGTYATSATYHPNGLIKSHSYGNGFAHTTTLYTSGLPNTFYDLRGSTYALNHAFGYDANRNLTLWDDRVSSLYDVQASYDGMDRLDVISDSYLGAGDVDYDTMGNITSYTLGSQAITYVYDSSKRLDHTTGSQDYTFAYDDRGNVVHNGRIGFTYNAANQMVGADGYSYVYDGNNKRVKQMDSHGTSYSFYGSNGRLLFRQESGVPVDYYYLGAKLVAKKKGSTVTYRHTDYLGSPTAESDASGAVTARQHYQPFGASIDPPIDDIGYTGHKFDTDLGLSYMQARYYDPVLGRFMANDPVMYKVLRPMTFGRYAYANNNPYTYTDPDGQDAVFAVDPNGAGGNGHTTLYFQDESGEWYAYNQGAAGDPNSSGNNGYVSGADADAGVSIAAVPANSVPSDGLKIESTPKQDGQIAASAAESQQAHNSGEVEYNLYSNNCTDAAVDVVNNSDAGITVSNPTFTVRPNSWMEDVRNDPESITYEE